MTLLGRQRKLPAEPTFREHVGKGDARAVRNLVRSTGFFSAEEIAVAGELVEETLTARSPSGYRFLFADYGDELAAYSCYGRVPATESSWDLYWIAVRPSWQGQGLGKMVLRLTEERVLAAGGGRIWVETSGREIYRSTRAFYRRSGYHKAAILDGFYGPADPKFIFVKSVLPPAS